MTLSHRIALAVITSFALAACSGPVPTVSNAIDYGPRSQLDADGCYTEAAIGASAGDMRAPLDVPAATGEAPAGPGFEIRGEYEALLKLATGEPAPCNEKIIVAIMKMPRHDASRYVDAILSRSRAAVNSPLPSRSQILSVEQENELENKFLYDIGPLLPDSK